MTELNMGDALREALRVPRPWIVLDEVRNGYDAGTAPGEPADPEQTGAGE